MGAAPCFDCSCLGSWGIAIRSNFNLGLEVTFYRGERYFGLTEIYITIKQNSFNVYL
jgi:hypothetical protein